MQPLRFVHVHVEGLQQPLGLGQVVCIHLLVDQGQILPIALCVLHGSHKLKVNLRHQNLEIISQISMINDMRVTLLVFPVA